MAISWNPRGYQPVTGYHEEISRKVEREIALRRVIDNDLAMSNVTDVNLEEKVRDQMRWRA